MGNKGVKVVPDQVDLDIPVWSEDERPARLAACRFAGDSDGLLLFLVHQEARHAVQSGSIAFEQLVVECGVGVRNRLGARSRAREVG